MDATESLAATRAFVDEARAVGVLDPTTHARLVAEIDRRAALGGGVGVPPAGQSRGPGTQVGRAGQTADPARPGVPPIRAPRMRARPRRRLAEALTSELAVHGLAYLGVLLLFAAALGFSLFAFSAVGPVTRAGAALAAPGALAVAAGLLLHRDMPLVGRGLEWLAGAVLPLVALALLADTLPPGARLVAAWAAVLGGLAGVYAVVARRRPATALRLLVGPLAWLGVGVVTLVLTGAPTAWQAAAAAVAVAMTLGVLGDVPAGPLWRATLAVAAPSSGTALAAAMVLAWRDGWPALPVLVAGMASIVVLELAASCGWSVRGVVAGHLVVAAGTSAAVAPAWGVGWAGAVGTAAAVGVLVAGAPASAGGWRRRPMATTELVTVAAGGIVALIAAAATDVTLALAWGAAALWGHGHRALHGGRAGTEVRGHARGRPVGLVSAVVASGAPPGALVGVALAWSVDAAVVLAAGTVAATALTARLRHLGTVDALWPAAAGTLATLLTALGVPPPALGGVGAWPLVGLLAATGLAVALAVRLPVGVRVWWSASAWALAARGALAAAGVEAAAAATALFVLAAATVAAAWVGATGRGGVQRLPVPWRTAAPHAAAAGHLGLLGIAATTTHAELPWMAAFGVAWAITAGAAADGRAPWPGWLGVVLASGHLTAGLLVPALATGGAALPWVGAGLATGIAAAHRRRSGAGLAAAALVLAPAALAGSGWLALALLLVAATAAAASWQATDALARVGWAVASALAAAAAWMLGLAAAGVTGAEATAMTTVVGGVAAVLVAILAGVSLPRPLAGAWTAVCVVGAVSAGLASGDAHVAAAGIALAAAGTGTAAGALAVPSLREAAAVLGVLAGGATLAAVDPEQGGAVAAAVTVGLSLSGAGLAWWWERPDSPWLRPLAVAAVIVSALGVGLALPAPRLMLVALLAVAVQSAAAGLLMRSPAVLAAAPPAAALAWLVALGDLVPGGLVPATAPIGLALLAEAEIARWRGDRIAEAAPAIEAAGVATLAVPILVEAAVGDLAYALLGVLTGAALAVWGAATRVRRRLSAGAIVASGSVGLVVAVPVVRALPGLAGAWLWAALAAVGTLLVAGATGLERGRARVAGARRRLEDLLAGWD